MDWQEGLWTNAKSKWDEFQIQTQQMQEVQQPLLLWLTLDMLLNIIGILHKGWGSSHKVNGPDLKKMTTLLKQFEHTKLPM
jgi:hypothetical protein